MRSRPHWVKEPVVSVICRESAWQLPSEPRALTYMSTSHMLIDWPGETVMVRWQLRLVRREGYEGAWRMPLSVTMGESVFVQMSLGFWDVRATAKF